MSCPQEPIPAGWYVWRGVAVPLELQQFAMDVRDHVRSYPYGTIAKTLQYQGQTVGAFVSHHSWTFRGGQLVTGLCIPGVSLIIQQGGVGATATQDSLDAPDPTAAVYGADDVPAGGPDWGLVGLTAGTVFAIGAAFWLAIRFAGKKEASS